MVDKQRVSKGDRLTLSLVSWGRLGEAMAYYQGQETFVFGGIPGEQVVAQVTRISRKYIAAQVIQVLEPSPDRVAPPCFYYGQCTGCQWQHVAYERQLAIKRERVIDALIRVGGFASPPVSPVTPAPEQYGYRNHARFTVGHGGVLGFVNRETHQFVQIDHCMLMHAGITRLLVQLQGKCSETSQLSIRAGKETGDFLVQPRLKSSDISVPTGQKHYVDFLGGRNFRVASPSFFQVNVEQAAQLAQAVRQVLELRGDETLLDAYAGVGTFAILLAPCVRRVIAVEESSAAVADARENATGLDNVEFVVGKAEDMIENLSEQPDVAVLDPPRSGCHPTTLRHLIQLSPRRIAYVSCDPETLARDLKFLCASHYDLEQVKALDMFPQTHHVECVAALSRRRYSPDPDPGNSQITLASASPRRRELLTEMGINFQVMPSNIPEEPQPGESPQELVQRLSLAKALAVASKAGRGYVVGADSVVVLNGRAIGKPQDADEARRMLQDLRGTRHYVTTGLSVIDVVSGRHRTSSFVSYVTLRQFSDAEIEASIASGTPLDKAGAYAIQDRELCPAESVEGCYTNVVGLPLCRLVEMLQELDYQFPHDFAPSAPEGCHNCLLSQVRPPC